jgi:two-component system cell cycle sensor histidine kinase/response regulator CckA
MSEQNDRVILLAEDEPVVRNFIQAALTNAGYLVLAATDGSEALQLSRAYDGTIDLVLSDVHMPKLIGPDLVGVLVKERPGIRAVMMTGKSSGRIPEVLRPEMLRKPFLPKQLVEKIRHAFLSPPNSKLDDRRDLQAT